MTTGSTQFIVPNIFDYTEDAAEELKLLIIDDDEVDQMVIRRSASKTNLNARIYTSNSGKEGLELIQKQSFDCIIIDFRLPDMDGLEVIEKINQLKIAVPLLIVTSHGDERIAAQAIRLGAADYIPKSFLTPDGIYHSIRNAIRLHKAEQEKQLTEERLRVTQSQLELLISNSPIGFWSTDADGSFNFAKGMAYDLLGIPSHKIVGKSFYEAFASYPRILARYKRALHGEIVQSVDEANQHFFKSHYVPVYNDKGIISGVTGFAIDITDRVKNERELLKAKEVAENSVRVKEQFLANISHEIRTPMNGIIGLANVLKKTQLTVDQHKYLSAISKSADNLMQVINDLLDFSKITANQFTFEDVEFNLTELVQDVVDLMDNKARERYNKLSIKLGNSVPVYLSGDPLRLRQVILNLIGNAIKFTEDGEIKLLIHNLEESEESILLEFTVEDTGIGIPEEKLHTIFESFNQGSNDTTRKYGGTGLGLTISKNIVEMQGGTISVRSQPMVGSAFTFNLPFHKPEQKEKPNLESHEEEDLLVNQLSGVKALLAEDNEINQLLINTVLAGWDTEVETVYNGLQALEKVTQCKYDFILMDMQMPEMDGYEAIGKIRSSNAPYAQIPIIALTAHASDDEVKKCLDAGANAYVSKPFEPDHLYNTIVELLNLKVNSTSVNLSILKGVAGDNPSFITEVLKMYIDSTPSAVDNLHKQVINENLDEVRLSLAELYDSVSVISAKPMLTTLEKMAEIIDFRNFSMLKRLSEQVIEECSELMELLRIEYDKLHHNDFTR